MKQQQYNRPILSDDLEERIEDAIQAFLKRGTWKEWGMDKVREQGAAILLHGAPGLGKTITAYYIAHKLHLRIVEVSMADYGSDKPGELARNIRKIFSGEQTVARLEKRHDPIIFLDECDAMLVSRHKLGPDMMWMLEPINALLNEIGKYPGLILLATNLVTMLDDAVERRLIAKVRFDKPDKYLRRKMWVTKWPEKFPVQPTEQEFAQLAEFDLTGAQIENAFILFAGKCIKDPKLLAVKELISFLQFHWRSYHQG